MTVPTRSIALMGQSNASGRDTPLALPAGVPANRSRAWKFTHANAWATCLEPADGPGGSIYPILDDINAGVSPASSMLDALAVSFPNEHFGVVVSAKGGTTIAQWSPASATNTLYGAALARMRAAEATGTSIEAVVWYQGETDAGNGTQSSWLAAFTALVKFWRLNLNKPDLPVVLVQIGDLGSNVLNVVPANWTALQTIQAGTSIPNVTVVSAAGLPLMSDGQHLTAAAQVELGRRIAAALRPFLGQP